MNEITAAIRKKAEDWANDGEFGYPEPDDKVNIWMFEKLKAAYTCGGEDAIGFMLKFDEWLHLRYRPIEEDNYQGLYRNRTHEEGNKYFTKVELLLKYMEETKL